MVEVCGGDGGWSGLICLLEVSVYNYQHRSNHRLLWMLTLSIASSVPHHISIVSYITGYLGIYYPLSLYHLVLCDVHNTL